MIKQLIVEALPVVISRNAGAAAVFSEAVAVEFEAEKRGSELLARSLTSGTPREVLVNWHVDKLRANSLQSKDQVFQIAAVFDIPTADLCAASEQNAFQEVFRTRNKIIHEMDVDFSQANRSRFPRPRDSIVRDVNRIFLVAERFLAQVDKRTV